MRVAVWQHRQCLEEPPSEREPVCVVEVQRGEQAGRSRSRRRAESSSVVVVSTVVVVLRSDVVRGASSSADSLVAVHCKEGITSQLDYTTHVRECEPVRLSDSLSGVPPPPAPSPLSLPLPATTLLLFHSLSLKEALFNAANARAVDAHTPHVY